MCTLNFLHRATLKAFKIVGRVFVYISEGHRDLLEQVQTCFKLPHTQCLQAYKKGKMHPLRLSHRPFSHFHTKYIHTFTPSQAPAIGPSPLMMKKTTGSELAHHHQQPIENGIPTCMKVRTLSNTFTLD